MEPSDPLDADYLIEIEQRARRFSGAYIGTSGTLAAGVLLLNKERKRLMSTISDLEEQNAALRNAVEQRLGGANDSPVDPVRVDDAGDDGVPQVLVDYILQGERELHEQRRQTGDGVMNAPPDNHEVSRSERLLLDAAAAVRDRRKSYGPPTEHFSITAALVNAAFGTSFTARDWATCMILDKVARSRGPLDHPDNDIDAAGYSACRAECRVP